MQLQTEGISGTSFENLRQWGASGGNEKQVDFLKQKKTAIC
jgi:hypothetical protein